MPDPFYASLRPKGGSPYNKRELLFGSGLFVNQVGTRIYIDLNSQSFVSGVIGPQGPSGNQGIQGLQGIQGIAGQDGEDGQDGATGSQGPTGPSGAIGPQGDQGIQGLQGIQGNQGIQGIQGVAGPSGLSTADPQLREDFTNASGVWVKDGTNLGLGKKVFKQKNALNNLEFRTIIAGSGIQLTENSNDIVFDNTLVDDLALTDSIATKLRTDFSNASGLWIKTASNIGSSGIGLFKQKYGSNLEFKKIVAESNITITENTSSLTFNSDDTSKISTSSNSGSGITIAKTKLGTDLPFKSLVGGDACTVNSQENEIVVNCGQDQFTIIGASTSWPLQPSTLQEFSNNNQRRITVDLINYKKFRILANVNTTGSASSVLGIQYSLDGGSTWKGMNNGTSGSNSTTTLSLNGTGSKVSSWANISSEAITYNILVRIAGSGGNSLASPAVTLFAIQFK